MGGGRPGARSELTEQKAFERPELRDRAGTTKETPHFPEIQIREWMARVRVLLPGWRNHPQFEDIVATSYPFMWVALQNAEGRPERDHTGLALAGAWCGAHKFLRSPMNMRSRQTSRGNSRPEQISLTDWQTLWGEEGALPTPTEPDFAPALIEWLSALEALAERPPRAREALWLGCVEGLSRREIMERMGLSRDPVYKRLQGVWVIPYTHPGPVAHNEARKVASRAG